MPCRESQIVRLERLERFVRVMKGLFALSFVLVAGWFILVRYVSASTPDDKILRVRRIVIEDSAGQSTPTVRGANFEPRQKTAR
jgi:hypothetical protein